MNPPQNSGQIPNTSSSLPQVNPVINPQMGMPNPHQMGMLNPQQMGNGNLGGFVPNNRPNLPQTSFMNFPNQPFPLQNPMGQFHNGGGNFNPFAPNQQQGQFFPQNPMNPAQFNQNVGLPTGQFAAQNLLQNMCQLLQTQNTQFAPGNFPMLHNQMGPQGPNFLANPQFQMGPQDLSFLVNQQFGSGNPNGPVQHVNQEQLRLFNASKPFPNTGQPLQGTQAPQNPHPNLANFQNPMAYGFGPQDLSFLVNRPFGFGNPNGPMQQHVNQEQQRFSSQAMDVNTGQHVNGNSFLPHASGPLQTSQAPNPPPTHLTNLQERNGNEAANVNAKWTEPQRKTFNTHKKNNVSQSSFKPQSNHTKHTKGRFGMHDYNKNKGRNDANSGFPNSTNQIRAQKKVPCLNYTEQEIKQWREERKKHYPSTANMEKKLTEKPTLEEEAKLRQQQLKEILAKQAELGCEVADVPLPYLPEEERNPESKWNKKGKFQKKRGQRPNQADRFTKKTRRVHQGSPRNQGGCTSGSPIKREPSLLQKLLTRDIKRDKTRLLQAFRFMASNAFFVSDSPDRPLTFPAVVVREDEGKGGGGEGVVLEKVEEEEGEIID